MVTSLAQASSSASAVQHREGTFQLPSLLLADGTTLSDVVVAYETWGTLADDSTNTVLICHALTGDAHVRDDHAPDDPRAGWWGPLVGPGRAIDTDQYFVIASNIAGSCYGTTGPASPHPVDGQPWGIRFPHITINDMVRLQQALLQHLGIARLTAVIGGSIGGLQALEWAIAYPEMIEQAIVIAAADRLGAQGIAVDTIARQAIMADPRWQNGNYPPGEGPDTGLAIARMLAMLTYTSAANLDQRFGRRLAERTVTWPEFGPRYDVETYLLHQGDKLVRRFDANAYLYLTSAMDRYDAAAPYGNLADALRRIRARVLGVGISSDWLYPPQSIRELVSQMKSVGLDARYAEITSPNGHDAFLQEWDQLTDLIGSALTRSASPK